MRTLAFALLALVACSSEGQLGPNAVDTALPAFDPDRVVYADGCAPVPEAMACVEANPVQFQPANPNVTRTCEELGYTCCDTSTWISKAAASCIADDDPRFNALYDNIVTTTCGSQVFGPIHEVYEDNNLEGFIGVGVHAATGRVTWTDSGDGVFS